MGFVQRRLLRAVLKVVDHPKLTLLLCGVMLAASVALAVLRLSISTDQNKLFSPDVGFFRDWLAFARRFPQNEALYVVIEPSAAASVPAVERWTTLADAIARQLSQLPEYVRATDYRVPLDQLGAQGLLFEEPGRLRQIIQDARRLWPLARLWGEKPGGLTVLLGTLPIERFLTALLTQNPDEETARFTVLLADSWNISLRDAAQSLDFGPHIPDLASLDAADPSRLGYYYVPDETDRTRHLLLVRVYERVDYTSLTASSRAIEAIRASVRQAAQGFPEFTVGVTGRPALQADEMRVTDRDSHVAEAVALVTVFIGMVVMLRSIWLALAAEIALAVGIGWTFGFATLAVGELNLLSIVFVIALIGIGLDYLVQILTRYRREARRYVRATAIWARVFRHVGPPIVTACLGAAGAFFVAVFTDFRGAADLGIIAGGGLLLCLLAGYTVLPSLLVLFPPRLKQVDYSARYPATPPPPRGWRHLVFPLIWIGALLAGIPVAMKSDFDPNLLNLQARKLESVRLIRKVQTWSAVVLSSDVDMLRKVREALNDAPTIARTESILDAYDNLAFIQSQKTDLSPIQWTDPPSPAPADLARLGSKADALAGHFERAFPRPTTRPQPGLGDAVTMLRRFAQTLAAGSEEDRQRMADRLALWQVGFVAQLRRLTAQLTPHALDIGKVPPELRNHFVSADGLYALYIYPRHDLWKGENLSRFVDEVDARVAQVPGSPCVTGIASNIRHSTGSIEWSFYKATAYALALIFVLVLIDLRNLGQTLLTVSVLALGLPMLIVVMGLLGVNWNLANFFGLPILIGAGHEYGVFMMHRYREVVHHPRRIWKAWDVSDRALLLCAFITASSFGFFWALGHHRGLKSLGLVMAVGSACIYLATILVVRPLLMWRIERKDIHADK